MKRFPIYALAAVIFAACGYSVPNDPMALAAPASFSTALSPAQGVAAMRKLSFMKGTWRLWSVQMWGYNAREQKLRAYQFTSRGMFTKTASGWQSGTFNSVSDYNDVAVSIRKRSPNAFDWLARFPNDSHTAIQACRK